MEGGELDLSWEGAKHLQITSLDFLIHVIELDSLHGFLHRGL